MARPRQRQEYPEWWERVSSGYGDDRRRDWPTEDRWWDRDPYGGPKREYGPDYRDPWGRHYMQSMPYWLYAWPLPSAFAGDRYF
ncbi:hypothetical protein QW131_29625 [Roseibium salinum]|nr:hypothetical protein [Roseibium salinum]